MSSIINILLFIFIDALGVKVISQERSIFRKLLKAVIYFVIAFAAIVLYFGNFNPS